VLANREAGFLKRSYFEFSTDKRGRWNSSWGFVDWNGLGQSRLVTAEGFASREALRVADCVSSWLEGCDREPV
jgi:hypothetical protein